LAYFDFYLLFVNDSNILLHTKKKKKDVIVGDSSQNMNTQTDWTPQVGMEFNSVDDAWKHWEIYEKQMGFGVRKHFQNKVS
jgi:hypothetical protein